MAVKPHRPNPLTPEGKAYIALCDAKLPRACKLHGWFGMDERARAMIHDLMVAILEGRETTESEPVPRTISVGKFNRALRKAIKRAA